jgi:arginyl-tRNA synthetase
LIVEFDDLPPAMLLKSNQTTTYFTRDLATIKFRNENPSLKSDLYIYEVGAEQTLHFQQVFAAAAKLGWAKREDFKHVTHGLILGKDGKKMSTRKGTTVKIEEWLTEMIEKAQKIDEESARTVGIGAVKYFDLKHDPNTAYKFDWEEALKLDGDSGPYLQYAAVRIKSVLKDVVSVASDLTNTDLNQEELAVLRWLYRFPEVIETAAKEFSPNLVAGFLFELSSRFNAFYNQHRILGTSQERFRLSLAKATGQTLETGLNILGIKVPERM